MSNSVYLGEVRDARLALPGWDKAEFDASQWKPVRDSNASLEPLQPLAMPPVRAGKPIPAVRVTTPKPGVHIVDLGRNFTGVPEVTLRIPSGTRVLLRYGELLNPDGTLNPLTSVCGQIKGTRQDSSGREVSKGGPGAPAIACQQDVYIARGGGAEVYRPEFTFHGFRYVEITGLPEAPALADVCGIAMRTDLAEVGSFECSSERLNRIQTMCRQTFLSNVVSVQSDCPHRERFAYGGDIVATSESFLMNFDMAEFYAKTVRDWADGARPDGRLTDTAPFVGIDYCGVGWAMVHPLLLEQLHQHYGAKSLLEELSRNGQSAQAFALANRSDFPSWGWMLENGATTLWEHWAGSDNTYSHNHPMFGSVSGWFFRWLGGIQPASDAVGFDRIEIRPQVVPGLEWVKCSHRSIRGLIESNWSAAPKQLEYVIVIPPDAGALIRLPSLEGGVLTEGGLPIAEAAGIEVLEAGSASYTLRASSGRYRFTIRRER